MSASMPFLPRREVVSEEPEYTCVESFCGAGGMSLGLERAGFRVLKAFDLEETAVRTYNSWGSSVGVVADASEVSGSELTPDGTDLDLFAGGPPCQGFSRQKKGAEDGDARNRLVLEYVRMVRETTPRFFLIENVKMFGGKRGREFVAALREELSDYGLFPNTYDASDYGLAQTRERFIIVGKRLDIEAPFRIPPPTSETATVRDAIGDLPSPPADGSPHLEVPNHQRANISSENEERISHVPPGGGWQDIPEELRLECHRNVDISKGGWPDVYGRLEWEGQAPTITVGFDNFSRGRYAHPEEDRPITHREGARLQGFPDEVVFEGNKDDARRQIGNAVPPPLAEAVGREIRRTLLAEDGIEMPEYLPNFMHPLFGGNR